MPTFKRNVDTPIVNLSAKLDVRTNNEVLDGESVNETGLVCSDLVNADLFYSKALASRLGVADVCGGIVNASGGSQQIFPVLSGLFFATVNYLALVPTQRWNYTQDLNIATPVSASTLYPGNIIVPSGQTNISTASIRMMEQETSGTYNSLVAANQLNYEVDMRMTIVRLDQTTIPLSGASYFSGNGFFHDIAVSGSKPSYALNFPSVAATPSGTSAWSQSTQATFIPEGVAVSRVKFSGMTNVVPGDAGPVGYLNYANYFSDKRDVSFTFESPITLLSGNVYFAYLEANQTSGTVDRLFTPLAVESSVAEPNAQLLEMYMYKSSRILAAPPLTYKNVLMFDTYKHIAPSYALVDNFSANQDLMSPLVSGNSLMNHIKVQTQGTGFNPLVTAPSVTTDAVEFGEVITIPSGTYTIFGGYIYAAPNDPAAVYPPTSVVKGGFTRNKARISGTGYNLGYAMSLSTIDAHTGTIAAGNYNISQRTILQTYSGNHVFDSSEVDNYFIPNTINPNYNLEQIVGIFNNPITISTSGTELLLSVKYYDYQSKGNYTDYSYYASAPSGPPPINQTFTFSSFMRHGLQTQNIYPSGIYVVNSNNDGKTFITTSGNGFTSVNNDLACGLFKTISGAAITGIYDYSISTDRNKKIIYEQADKISYFTLQQPQKVNHVNIQSGQTINVNGLYNHSTFQNLLFATNYSLDAPLVWDSIYYNPSGISRSMQPHGKRPTFKVYEVPNPTAMSGVALYSGDTVQLMLSTQMRSGGLRSSEINEYRVSGMDHNGTAYPSGTAFALKISGSDIYNPNYNPDTVQYKFDVLPQATYVWATHVEAFASGNSSLQVSGNIFYLAGLADNSNLPFSGQISNPLVNSGTFINTGVAPFNYPSGVYINDFSLTTLTQEIPNVISYNQTYLTDQVNTPKYKKSIVFNNLLVMAGDPNNNSSLWVSEQLAPEIIGTDGQVCNLVPIDPDDRQVITGLEVFGDRLFVFKQNSFYVLTYTGDNSNPFQIQKKSDVVGCVGFFTTVSTDQGVYGLSSHGPFIAVPNGIQTIGDMIQPLYQELDHTDLTFAVAIHDRDRQQILWSITNDYTSPDRNTGLVFSYAENAWCLRQGGMWNAGNIVYDEDQFSLLFGGDSLGQIFELNVGDTDSDVIFVSSEGTSADRNVTLSFTTPWLNLNNSTTLKQLRYLKINCANSDQRLRCDVFFDEDETKSPFSRYMSMNVPLINRVISLGQTCRVVKFKVTSVGVPDAIKINSIQIGYTDLGNNSTLV